MSRYEASISLLGSQPRKVSLRLRYRTPVTAMLGAQSFMGGENGLAFTYTPGEGLIALRNDPTPELDKAQSYPLGPELNGQFLQPVRHG